MAQSQTPETAPGQEPQILIIHLYGPPYVIDCNVCGIECLDTQAVAVNSNGYVVPNDYEGEWCGLGCCPACYEKHARGELDWYDLWSKP